MILSLITLASVLFVTPSWGALNKEEFEEYIEPMCFQLDETTRNPLINGQVNPLAQTLENFISLAEKFETSNHNLGLKEELFYFIRNYTYDNFEYTSLGDTAVWVPKETNFDVVGTFWEPDENQRKRLPDGQDPFTDPEKCSIFYMMSHSIIRKPRKENAERAATNKTRNSVYEPFNLDDQYPMETGVVAIRGTNVGVTLGRVLMGMYVGLNENRKKPISELKIIKNIEVEGQAALVDPLYQLTLAEVLALATWRPEVGNREKLAADGQWVSAPIGNDLDTKDICPMIYKLDETTNSAYSFSSARGATDGFILGRIVKSIERRNRKNGGIMQSFILGRIVKSIERRNRNAKLSQILRMYYSRGGISEQDEELGQIWVSFCNRQSVLHPMEQTLQQQVLLYELLVGTGTKNAKMNADYSWNYYNTQKNSIFGYGVGDIRDYCGRALTVDKPEDLPLESPLDVIAVIDTSDGDENIKKQQLILGYLAKQLDLSYSGSRMTVLTDQKESVDANGKILLNSIVSDNPSTACASCSITQFDSDETPSAPEDEVIVAVDQLLQAKKENQTKYSGVNGKVVIYFNFKDDELSGKSSQIQRRVDTALRDLHIRHQDTAMYALGRAPELVKKYARNDLAFVMSAVDEAESIVGKKLFDKISTTPATLQFHNCEDGKQENSAIYEDFVSPNSVQHWAMPAKYFHRSRDIVFTFEAQFGPLRVCRSRATVSPELQKSSCQDVASGQKKEFKFSNPCKSFTEISCAPFYFSILGINNTASDAKQEYCTDTNTENQCRTLDQIKFKVIHEGIRCSGSIGLVATPVLLLIGIALLNILSKKF